jgi:hypothetical protein
LTNSSQTRFGKKSFRCHPSTTKALTPQAIDIQALFSGKSLKSDPHGTLCRLSWHWAKFVNDKHQDNAPPPLIFPEANEKWKD